MKVHLRNLNALVVDDHKTNHKRNYLLIDLNPYLLLKEAPFVKCYHRNLMGALHHQMVGISFF